MKNVIVLGYPVPGYSQSRTEAYGYRTLQFISPLSESYSVTVICLNKAIPEIYTLTRKNIHYIEIPAFSKKEYHDLIRSADPVAIIAISISNSIIAGLYRKIAPLWFDIYGDPLTESQLAQYYSDKFYGTLSPRKNLETILKRGDKFSVLSMPQKYCLIGEIALQGRLNKHTVGYDFAEIIYPGLGPPLAIMDVPIHKKRRQDDLTIVWSGGYNAWSDPETLFLGLESAMRKYNNIKFISTGGPAVTKAKYENFLTLIENSLYKKNFFLLGWQKTTEDVYKIWEEADYGIITDFSCYETLIGSRTRVFEKLGLFLPVIISRGSEIAEIVESYKVGITFKSGDADDLARKLITLYENREIHDTYASNIPKFIEDFSFKQTLSPLLKWLKNPCHSPDKENSPGVKSKVFGYFAYLRRALKWKVFHKF